MDGGVSLTQKPMREIRTEGYPGSQLTSAFNTSRALSFAMGPCLSISAPRLSKLHIETRLLVTLCDAAWIRHNPTLKGEDKAAGAVVEEAEGVGVPLLLPVVDDVPML